VTDATSGQPIGGAQITIRGTNTGTLGRPDGTFALSVPNEPVSLAELRYGVSVTDKCVDWATTERMLRHAHRQLRACGGRTLEG
jgi:hypothetical protein